MIKVFVLCIVTGVCTLALAIVGGSHALFFLAGATLEAALVMWVMRHDT